MLKRILFISAALFGVAFGLAIFLGVFSPKPPRPEIEKVVFGPQRACLVLSQRVKVSRFVISEKQGKTILDQRFARVRRDRLEALFDWSPDREYRFRVTGPWGSAVLIQKSPGQRKSDLSVNFLAPFAGSAGWEAKGGVDPEYQDKGAMIKGGVTTCTLILTSHNQQPGLAKAKVFLPGGFEVISRDLPPFVRRTESQGRQVLDFNQRLYSEQDNFALVFRVRAPRTGTFPLEALVEFRSGEKVKKYRRSVLITVMEPEQFSRSIKVKQTFLPTTSTGLPDKRAEKNTIYFKPPLVRKIADMLGVEPQVRNYWSPYTYQALVLENKTQSTVSLLITSRITDGAGRATPRAFKPPDIFKGSLKNDSVAVSHTLLPGETDRVVIPVFITSRPRPGLYKRRLSIRPMGSQAKMAGLDLDLVITTTNQNALIFTLLAFLVSLGSFLWLVFSFRGMIRAFKVRWVVIVALFGALSFVGVNLPLRVFGALIQGLLGPFSVLVLGFFNDLLYFALLVALLRLIPQKGVATLLILVRYALSVMLTGGFHLTDFLYVGTAILVKEGALHLSGVTRKGADFEWTWAGTGFLALFLALGDTYLNATSLYVHMLLFRLYFADWYIWLNLIFNGMIYTTIGTFLGKRFSDRLIWAED